MDADAASLARAIREHCLRMKEALSNYALAVSVGGDQSETHIIYQQQIKAINEAINHYASRIK